LRTATAAASNNVISNNFILNVRGNGTLGDAAVSLGIAGGNGDQYVHNTVAMTGDMDPGAAASTTQTPVTCRIAGAPANLTVRNNIFFWDCSMNTVALTGACMMVPSATFAFGTGALDNNDYFFPLVNTQARTGALGTTSLATTFFATLANWQAALTPARDANSISANPTFVSATSNLHINTGLTPTQLESGGASLGITIDIDNQTRPGPAGSVNGGATAPDIGADEFDGVPLDLSAPSISFTALGNTCTTGARTLSANITDASGVPTVGAGLPVLYWRVNAGAYTPATGTFIAGSQYDFSFGGTAVNGDVVSYYIVAQDNAGTPNVGANPAAGAAGFTANPPAAATAPTTPASYAVGIALAGNYNVGAGEPAPFNTITNAVTTYNAGCMTSAVTFTLVDATYPSETFPITINNVPVASATNTLTIKAGTTTTVTGSNATAIFLLNGADYVTIDGSTSATANTVCPPSAASRNLTISNTNTGTASSVVWIASTTGNAATNNRVMNCILTGNATTTTNVVVGAGGATVGSGPTAAPDNTSIVNNQISTAVFGVFVGGVAAGTKTQNTVINQNTLSTFTIGGIAAPFQNNLTISGNSVTGITNATSSDAIGINAGYGVTGGISTTTTGLADGVSNATITNNVIGTVTQTNTFSAVGIALGNSLTGTSLIANNTVSGVGANATSGDVAIGIYFGGGTAAANIIHNTVEMKGTFAGGSMPSYALGMHNSTVTTNVLNNILVNTQNNGATLAPCHWLGLRPTCHHVEHELQRPVRKRCQRCHRSDHIDERGCKPHHLRQLANEQRQGRQFQERRSGVRERHGPAPGRRQCEQPGQLVQRGYNDLGDHRHRLWNSPGISDHRCG
jgi:hypothetical protein